MIIGITALFLIIIPFWQSGENDIHYHWIWWILLNVVWIVLIFTGVYVKNNEGQYKGYITAVERNGAVFVGYNAFLKTDLTSSNEDMACIDRGNKQLIERLKTAQENKENIVVEYEGVWQYKIGECPNTDWKIIRVVE